MEKIEAYRLSNGDIVESLVEAETIEQRLRFEEKVEQFAEKVGTYEGVEAIKNAIYEHADELAEILELR